MSDRGRQKGAQQHPEGGHGDRTRERLREQHESGGPEAEGSETSESLGTAAGERTGKRRLHEDREQHDEADKNSEKNRFVREGGDPGDYAR